MGKHHQIASQEKSTMADKDNSPPHKKHKNSKKWKYLILDNVSVVIIFSYL